MVIIMKRKNLHCNRALTKWEHPWFTAGLICLSLAVSPGCSKKKSESTAAVVTETTDTEIADDPSALQVEVPKCGELNDGETISRVRYQASTVKFGSTCVSETQTSTCSGGSMGSYTGSFSHESCVVNDPTAPQLDLSPIIVETGNSNEINFDDVQYSAPTDNGVYYYNCFYDNAIDGTVATTNNCSDFFLFQYDMLYNGNGEADFAYHSSYVPGTYEFYVKAESKWGVSDNYIPVLIKDLYQGGEDLVLDLDAQYANYSSLGPQSGNSSWASIAASAPGTSYDLQGTFSTGWVGSGIDIADPYALQFDGVSGFSAGHLNIGSQWNNEPEQSYSLWIYAEGTGADSTLLSNKVDSEGFALTLTDEGKVRLNIADATGIADYSTVVLADNPIGYWPLTQSTGSTISNLGSSGANLDASYPAGAPNVSLDSRIHNTYSHEVAADGQEVQLAHHADMFDFSAGGITVEAWVKSNGTTWANSYNFVSKRNQFLLGGASGSSSVRFYIYDGTSTWRSVNSPAIQNIDTWHHYVGTFDGTTARLYVDGVEVASSAITGISTSTAAINFGKDSGDVLNGKIQSVALYKYPLSQSRIEAHATSGLLNQDYCTSKKSVLNQWSNPVVTMNNASSKLYINGELVCEIDTAETGKSHANGNGDLIFGAYSFGGGAFKGKLAALRAYRSSLSPSTVDEDFFNLAPQFLEGPETIPGLAAWYDGSHGDSIITSGAQVTEWQDRSGNGRNLPEANPGTGAITINGSASPSGLSTIHFNGVNGTYFKLDNALEVGSAFAVYRYDGGASFTNHDGVFTASFGQVISGANGTTRLNSIFNQYHVNGTSSQELGDITVFKQSSHITGADTSIAFRYYIGGHTNDRVWHGDIGEVIIYSRALNAAERQRIEAYQKNKWGTP